MRSICVLSRKHRPSGFFWRVASETRAQTELEFGLGARCIGHAASAYPDMARHLGESTTSYLPVALFEQLKQWCATDIHVDGTDPSDKSDSLGVQRLNDRGVLRGSGFVEHAVFIPAQGLLTGVWCESEARRRPRLCWC
jgi:hypothetical protein